MSNFIENIREKLVEVLQDSSSFVPMQRIHVLKYFNLGVKLEEKELNLEGLIKKVGGFKNFDILIESEDVIIFRDNDSTFHDNYNIRIIYKNEKGNFVRCDTVTNTIDTAMIVYLAHKNNEKDAVPYLMKMLNIKFD